LDVADSQFCKVSHCKHKHTARIPSVAHCSADDPTLTKNYQYIFQSLIFFAINRKFGNSANKLRMPKSAAYSAAE